MKVSLSWLRDYISIDEDAYRIADALTMAGLEVDSVTDRYEWLNGVITGRINKIFPHPNADKLRICETDIGDGVISVVCGAPNAAEGMIVPVALPGLEFPDGSVMKKSVIRGVPSNGMICSETELSIGIDSSGIMSLSKSVRPGEKLPAALGLSDWVFEIDLTPNRADCLSIIGIAREIAALFGKELRYPECDIRDESSEITQKTSVEIIDRDHCPRYAARMFEDIKVEPSPFWLQDRLMSVGLRPINNIVDVTNFVMMEMGQPLHAFDYDLLAQNRIVVKLAQETESFTTLDEKKRTLSSDMLMICDAEKSVAIAGVMGGMNSEIGNNTSRVLLESAYFNPVSIRKTSKKIGLSTDASYRFERGVDPAGQVRAVNRISRILTDISAGTMVPGLIDENFITTKPAPISLSVKRTNELLGINLDRKTIRMFLEGIEFNTRETDEDSLEVTHPTFRVDIKRPIDLVEEVARLHGYNHIPTTLPLMALEAMPASKLMRYRERVRNILSGFGFFEVVNYSFIHEESTDRIRLGDSDERRRTVRVMNPLTEDQTVMRTSLIPGLLENMRLNLSKKNRDLKLFETGKIFIAEEGKDLPREVEILAGLWTGARNPASWCRKSEPCDFYDIKGLVEGLLSALGVNNASFSGIPPKECDFTRPYHSAMITISDKTIGCVGEIHPAVMKHYGMKEKAFGFEINFDILIGMLSDERSAETLPKYPSVDRDLTMIIDKTLESENIVQMIRDMDEKLVENITVFDVFEGGSLPETKRSVSFRITYRSEEGTLEDKLVNRMHKEISGKVIATFKADLPEA